MKLKYSQYLKDLQEILGYKPSHADVSKILSNAGCFVSANALSNRLFKDGFLNDNEISILNGYYNADKNLMNICFSENIPVSGNITSSISCGASINEKTNKGIYTISKKLLNDLGADSKTTEIIFSTGNSMEPTIFSGDSLLVDLSKKDVHDGKIYCVKIQGELYAKRLQKIPPSSIVVISDNPKYKNFDINLSKKIDFDFEILGEVLWWGRIAK